MDNLRWGRLEIDLVEFRGPTFEHIDNRLMALQLVKESLTRAVLFDPDGKVVIPADTLYKRSVLAIRGAFRPVSDIDIKMFEHAKEKFARLPDVIGGETVSIAEMTMADIANDAEIDTADFLRRVDLLSEQGFHVLISEFFRYFRVRQYLARYSNAPIGIVSYVNGFAQIIREDYYDGLDGGLLEGLGQLFVGDTIFYIFPNIEGGKIRDPIVRLEALPIADHLRPLVAFLQERGHVQAIKDFSLI